MIYSEMFSNGQDISMGPSVSTPFGFFVLEVRRSQSETIVVLFLFRLCSVFVSI